jgi:signal transduction histidine kinase
MIATLNEMKKILVIDDELGPRESLRILLKGTYDVQTVDGVDAGVAQIKEAPPDLIIMDIRMPGKSGIEGLREIREIDSDISVIMLTGFGALETAQEALRLGANDYLKKPFDTKEIMKVIAKQIDQGDVHRRRTAASSELQKLNASLMGELAQKERMANIGQASAELVHDIRNPLTIVISYVELLSDQLERCKEGLGEEFQETAEYMNIIEKNVARCQDMASSWQTQGSTDMSTLEVTSIKNLLTDLVSGVEPLAASCNARLTCDVDCEDAKVEVSQSQLLRAIHNIIANAIHAVADMREGRIQIKVTQIGNELDLVIQDNGEGMDEERLAKVFEPYYTTKDKSKGTGLGLYITKKIIEDHHGFIRISSTVGEGSVVTIRLPVAAES